MPGPQRRTPSGEAIGERLAVAIEQKFSQRRFAEKVGRSESVVSLWVSGAVPEAWDRLRRVCEVSGASADWLLGLPQAAPAGSVAPPADGDWAMIPRVSEQVAAGEATLDEAPPREQDWYAFRGPYVRHLIGKSPSEPGRRMMLVSVARGYKGESMIPTIRPGALVLVDKGPAGRGIVSDELVDGKIYLCRPGDEGVTLKRVFRAGESLMLWSDNPAHKPIPVALKGRKLQQVVLGRVRWIGQEDE